MELAVGFFIAIAIGLTGVGAGIITAPVLITVFHLPTAIAVGTALTFGAVVKFVIVPFYALRRQVNLRALLHMLAGGLPGVAIGSVMLWRMDVTKHQAVIALVLGVTIVTFALLTLLRVARPQSAAKPLKDAHWKLSAIALPIGAEVGFSSAGSGSLASLALMNYTRLEPAVVIGTDLCFGLGISIVGSGILVASGHYDPAILPRLLAGGVLGAIVAPNITALIPAKPLRIGLLLWIIYLGEQLVAKGFAH